MDDQTMAHATARSEARGTAEANRLWWTHPGLEAEGGRLTVAGRDAEALARGHGTPVYVYDLARIGEQIGALQTALDRVNLPSRLRKKVRGSFILIHAAVRWYSWISPPSRSTRTTAPSP